MSGNKDEVIHAYGGIEFSYLFLFFFSSRRRHTRFDCDWSSDVCSSDLHELTQLGLGNSTIVGIGGDPVVGSSFIDVLGRFESDPETELIVLVGEIGGDEIGRASCRERG